MRLRTSPRWHRLTLSPFLASSGGNARAALPCRAWRWLSALLCGATACGMAAAAPAFDPSGSTWGEWRSPASTDLEDRHNPMIEGAVEQRFELHRVGPATSVNAFGKLDYAADGKELDYNNKLRLALGIKLSHATAYGAALNVGAGMEVDRRFFPARSQGGLVLFADGYAAWAPRPLAEQDSTPAGPVAFPGLTWATLRYPGSFAAEERRDLIVEGAIEQGIDWFRVAGATFNTFAELKVTADTKQLDWNNVLRLGAGLKVRFALTPAIAAQIGVKRVHSRHWRSGTTGQDFQGFVAWSGAW